MKLSNDSLVGSIQVFCLILFYLLPAIFLYRWIGWWSLLPCTVFWGIVLLAGGAAARKIRNAREKESE